MLINGVPTTKEGKADMTRIQAEFVQTGHNTHVKYNPMTGIRTTLRVEGGTVHVKYEQRVDHILDLNVAQQNNFKGYNKNAYHHQTARIPNQVWWDWMPKVGFQKGHGFDMKKLKRLLNDSDYSKLKTVPGRI